MAQEGCIACGGAIDTRVCLTCNFTWGASGLIRLSTCTIHKAVIHNLSKDNGKGKKKKSSFQNSFRVPSEFHTPIFRHRQKSRCKKDDKNTLKQTLSRISYWILFFLVLKHNKCKRSRNTKKNLQPIHLQNPLSLSTSPSKHTPSMSLKIDPKPKN